MAPVIFSEDATELIRPFNSLNVAICDVGRYFIGTAGACAIATPLRNRCFRI